jgi:hypothetical protein
LAAATLPYSGHGFATAPREAISSQQGAVTCRPKQKINIPSLNVRVQSRIEISCCGKNIRSVIYRSSLNMLRKLIIPALLSASVIGLAGCGYSPGQRALSGGAIGAGGGAIVGAATGLGPGTGALIGAGAGALTGAATTHRQLNLGN